jgi:hypothetical protein
MSSTMGFPGFVDTCSQASVAYQVFGRREAGDITNSCEHTHDREDSQAWKLNEEGNLFHPRFTGGKPSQFRLNSLY